MGIVGIVAAMTIPNLVAAYKKHLVETKLKDTYSLLNNAIRLAEVENGSYNTWTLNTNNAGISTDIDGEKLWSYLKPYLKIKDVCHSKNGEIDNNWHPDSQKNKRMCAGKIYNSNTGDIASGGLGNYGANKYILMNNVGVLLQGTNDSRVMGKSYYVHLDLYINNSKMYNGVDYFTGTINYKDNAPHFNFTSGMSAVYNQHDSHGFATCEKIKNGGQSTEGKTAYQHCEEGLTNWATGIPCAALIYCNGWHIPNDYPVKF